MAGRAVVQFSNDNPTYAEERDIYAVMTILQS